MNASMSIRVQRYGELLGAIVLLAGCDVTDRTVGVRRGEQPQRDAGTDGGGVQTETGGATAAGGATGAGTGGVSGSPASGGRPGAGGTASGGAAPSAGGEDGGPG